MLISFSRSFQRDLGPLEFVCPKCGHLGTFNRLGQDCGIDDIITTGQRVCPSKRCCCVLFFIANGTRVISQYPSTKIAFDRENVPSTILKTFDEAITVHAQGCYVASAIMLRRTLEEICAERGATGKNLKNRISDLRSKILIPQELLDAMDELRLLGNDAAHIEAQSFNQVEKEELDIAIEFTKELLKSLYQYSSLLSRMRGLKKVNQSAV